MTINPNKPRIKDFASALAAIMAAGVITLLIPSLGDGGMYFLFLTAIIFSTLHGGWMTGIFAVGGSILINFWLLFQLNKFPMKFGDWLVMAFFGLAAGFTVYICYAQMEAERSRRLAESKYRMIFEDAITGIYETTVDGKYVAANPKLAMIFGYDTPESLIEKSVNLNEKFYVTAGRREEFIRLVNERGQISEFESEIYRRDGAKIWITENAVAVRDEKNNLIGFQGTSIEITDRKNAEAALQKAREQLEEKVAERTADLEQVNKSLRDEITERQRISEDLLRSEEKFRTLVDVVSDCVWEVDEKGIYTYISPKIVDVVGYEPEEMIGKKPYDFMGNDERQRIRNYLFPIVAERRNFVFMESINRHKNGTDVITETSGIPIYDASGKYCGYRGIVRDITERKRAENTIIEIERQLRSVVTAAPIILCAIDGNGIFTLSEGKGLELLNLQPGEVDGHSIFELYGAFPELIKDVRRALKGENFVSAVTLGEVIFETRFLPTFDEVGNVVQVIGVCFDVTGQKNVENELLSSQRQLRALSAHLESVREEERKYIARELHDELGQTLTALKIDLTKLGERIPNLQNESVRGQILGRVPIMIEIVDTAMETTRKIVAQLRPAVLDELGLAEAVEWQTNEFQKLTGIKCEIVINLSNKHLPQNLKTAMFRILQECLTNITRHAAATKVKVELNDEADILFLQIQDNGRGIGKEKIRNTKSFGISGMRERAFLLGGTFEITRPQNGGTQVTVKIPG